jgi:hypothetical protein
MVIRSIDQIFDLLTLEDLCEVWMSGEGNAELQLRSEIRTRILAGTIESYGEHEADTALAIHRPYFAETAKELGFTLTEVIAAERAAASLVNLRLGQLRLQGRDEFNERLTDAMSFVPDDLVDYAEELTSEASQSVLRFFSTPIGKGAQAGYREPFDSYPLQGRPFALWEDAHLLPVFGSVIRECPDFLGRHLERRFRKFEKRRSRALDHLSVDILCGALPGACGYKNLHYLTRKDSKDWSPELDGLVLFDRYVIVIEGKGTRLSNLTATSGSGSSDSGAIERKLHKLEKAVEQANKVRSYLTSEGVAPFFDERGKLVLEVDPKASDDVFVVTPTFQRRIGRRTNLPQLEVHRNAAFPFAVSVQDLRIMCETVSNPAELLHYMRWRSRIAENPRLLVMDELDMFLSYFYREQFHRALLLYPPEDSLIVEDKSGDFDDYYHGTADQPEMVYAPIVREFVERVSRTRPRGWLDAAGTCLDLSEAELAMFRTHEPMIQELIRMSSGTVAVGLPAPIQTEVPEAHLVSCLVVGVKEDQDWKEAWEIVGSEGGLYERVVFVSLDGVEKLHIVWAMSPSQFRFASSQVQALVAKYGD